MVSGKFCQQGGEASLNVPFVTGNQSAEPEQLAQDDRKSGYAVAGYCQDEAVCCDSGGNSGNPQQYHQQFKAQGLFLFFEDVRQKADRSCQQGIAVKRREVESKGEKERYTHLNAEFQRITRRDKKAFLSDQCKEIEENNRMGKTRDLFKKIKDTKGTFHAKMGSIKDTMVWT